MNIEKLINNNKFVDDFKLKFDFIIRSILDLVEKNSIDEMFEGEIEKQKSSQKASWLSPIVDIVLEHVIDDLDIDWVFVAGDGYDSVFEGNKLEHKFSMSSSNAWTGHPYSNKVDLHLLMKIELNEVSEIDKCWIAIANLKEHSYISSNSEKSSYATVKILIDDYDDVDIIYGELEKSRKFCKPILKDIT